MNFKRYIISGLVTLVPLGLTWWVMSFLYRQLVKFGTPLIRPIERTLTNRAPELAELIFNPWVEGLLSALATLIALYLLGWAASRVIGKQLLRALDRLIERLPLVKSIYGSVKKLIVVLQTKPEEVDRVVLIDFPHKEMKAIGLVTRTIEDSKTGQQIAAVYVPTTPNPTNGYLELVPIEQLTPTDWTMEEAMNFIISGGAIAPDDITFVNNMKQEST